MDVPAEIADFRVEKRGFMRPQRKDKRFDLWRSWPNGEDEVSMLRE